MKDIKDRKPARSDKRLTTQKRTQKMTVATAKTEMTKKLVTN